MVRSFFVPVILKNAMNKFLMTSLLLSALPAVDAVATEQPKLIVQITVDQLRGDLLKRYADHFVASGKSKGFKRFLDDGTLYTNAHYRHATTLTAVGHATLATGAIPSQHGLVSNDWYDRSTGKSMYCVADASNTLLGAKGYSSSAANLLASTFSDELFQATNGQAKIYAVSIKDRGAVLTGGHHGKAFWFDKKTGNMVTSTYYYPELPAFAEQFNQSDAKDAYLGASWSLSLKESQYHNDASNRPYQMPPKGFNLGFPHGMPADASATYYDMLTYTPYGDELTAKFAQHVVETQQLGADDITDYLSISFSVNDYVGHRFGPYSLEAEDNLVRLDKTLANLFSYLDKKIGLEHVLIALSADHGVDAIPEYKALRGSPALRAKAVEDINAAALSVAADLGIKGELIEKIALPDIYLNYGTIAASTSSIETVAQKLAEKVAQVNGVALALTAKELTEQNLQYDPIKAKVQNSYVASRAGDVVVVQKRSTMLQSYSAATHGSPYNYDTYVPLYFTGWKVKAKEYTRPVSPEDLAVTLSAVLGITQPDRATGQVLNEIVIR